MSNRVATSRIWIVAAVFTALAWIGCSEVRDDADSQMTAGTGAGATDKPAGQGGASGSSGAAGGGGVSAGPGGAGGAGGKANGAAGAAGATTTMMMDDGAATWSSIYTHVFRSCRVDVCHGAGVAQLNFATKEAAWESLVNKPAAEMYQCTKLGKQRVTPGEPENSLLYLKLDINSPCGQQMPPGGQLPEESRNRVRDWIAAGAKKD